MTKKSLIVIILTLLVLTACGTTGSSSDFSDENIATQPTDKISSGILFEFIGAKAVQPRTASIQTTIRIKHAQGVKFAPIIYQSSGVLGFTQPITQSLENIEEEWVDIPIELIINGSGEGTFGLGFDLVHPKNVGYSTMDFVSLGAGATVYFYATDERIYAGLGGMLYLKQADIQYQYDRAQLTEREYNLALRHLFSDTSLDVTPAITPTP